MSREIDPYNLSEDDKVYISQRPGLRQEFILQGLGDPLSDDYDPGNPDDDSDDSDDGYDEDGYPVNSEYPKPDNWSDLSDEEKRDYVYNGPTNPRPSGDPSENVGGDDDTNALDDLPPEKRWGEGMTQPELLKVVKARNADYDDDEKIEPESNSKDDLVAALKADDQELLEDDDEQVG